MKKRILSLALTLVLALGLAAPALAAEGRFADVEAGSWYGSAVELCAEKGIMVGTGTDTFSPEATLTDAECGVLALRLHDLLHGGDGSLEKAPEDQDGKMTLTLADGTTFEGYGYYGEEGSRVFSWWEWRNGVMGVCAQVPGWSYEEDISVNVQNQHAWMDAHPDICATEAPATLALNGVTYQGTAQCWMPVGPYVFMFKPRIEEAAEVNRIIKRAVYQEGAGLDADCWWRDAAYYADRNELNIDFSTPGEPTSRARFAIWLALATGELSPIRQVDVIPDVDDDRLAPDSVEDITMLYRTGVLTGKDAYGSFAPEGTLTRAEAATMVARVLDESLRVSEPLAALPTEGYTLTYLMDGEADCGVTYPVCPLASGTETREVGGILLLDGTLLPWPGSVYSSGLQQIGEYAYFAMWDESTEDPWDSLEGLMAADGTWAVPLGDYEMEELNAFAEDRRITRPYACHDGLYWDAGGHPVSQKFDWCGDLSAQGQGFVGLEGKIYRIQFNL